jgi:hypothetical protein
VVPNGTDKATNKRESTTDHVRESSTLRTQGFSNRGTRLWLLGGTGRDALLRRKLDQKRVDPVANYCNRSVVDPFRVQHHHDGGRAASSWLGLVVFKGLEKPILLKI